MTDKIEGRLRRRARSMGCRLRKSKARNPDTPGFGRFGLENCWGCFRGGFYDRDGWPLNMTLAEVESMLNTGEAEFRADMRQYGADMRQYGADMRQYGADMRQYRAEAESKT